MNSGQDPRPVSSHWWHGPFRRFAGTSRGAWVGAHLLHHLDRLALRLTHGQRSAGQMLGGIPVIILTTTGARSGFPRSVPLNALPDGPNYILIASNWGQASYPAWYHNIKANPMVTIGAAGRTISCLAFETSGDERERCWRRAVAIYPGYAVYQRRLRRPVPAMLAKPQEEISP